MILERVLSRQKIKRKIQLYKTEWCIKSWIRSVQSIQMILLKNLKTIIHKSKRVWNMIIQQSRELFLTKYQKWKQ